MVRTILHEYIHQKYLGEYLREAQQMKIQPLEPLMKTYKQEHFQARPSQ